MRRTRRAWLLAMLCGIAESSNARFRAFASASDVYVDFAIAAPIVDGLDVGFLELNSVVVKWQVDLRPAGARETDTH